MNLSQKTGEKKMDVNNYKAHCFKKAQAYLKEKFDFAGDENFFDAIDVSIKSKENRPEEYAKNLMAFHALFAEDDEQYKIALWNNLGCLTRPYLDETDFSAVELKFFDEIEAAKNSAEKYNSCFESQITPPPRIDDFRIKVKEVNFEDTEALKKQKKGYEPLPHSLLYWVFESKTEEFLGEFAFQNNSEGTFFDYQQFAFGGENDELFVVAAQILCNDALEGELDYMAGTPYNYVYEQKPFHPQVIRFIEHGKDDSRSRMLGKIGFLRDPNFRIKGEAGDVRYFRFVSISEEWEKWLNDLAKVMQKKHGISREKVINDVSWRLQPLYIEQRNKKNAPELYAESINLFHLIFAEHDVRFNVLLFEAAVSAIEISEVKNLNDYKDLDLSCIPYEKRQRGDFDESEFSKEEWGFLSSVIRDKDADDGKWERRSDATQTKLIKKAMKLPQLLIL